MNCGKCTSKSIMGFLGLLFFASGLACVVLGSMVIHRYYHKLTSIENVTDFYVIPSIVLIVVGFVLFFAGISGCCNMCRESKGCLCSFFVFLFFVFILLIAAAILGAVYRDDINKQVEKSVNETFYKYTGNESDPATLQVDDWQQTLKCCGIYNLTDWKVRLPYGKIPKSCYPNNIPNPLNVYTEGCYTKVKSGFDSYIGYIIGGAVGLLVILLLGMIGSCCLIYYKRNEDKYFTLS